MGFWIFKKKGDSDEKLSYLHSSLNESFSRIKEDMHGVGEWINHLNETKEHHHEKIRDLDIRLRVIEEFMNDLMEQSPLEEVSDDLSKQLSKQEQTAVRLNQTGGLSKRLSKQLSKQPNSIQTDLEESLYSLTTMERTVVWSLLNTDLLLNYEDLSRILGKDKSTVRGQINNIKRKIPWLIEEKSESNGSKRFNINEDKKREILVNYVGKKAKTTKSES